MEYNGIMSFKAKIKNYLFNEEYTIQHLFFNVLILGLDIIALISILFNFILKFSFFANAFAFAAVCLFTFSLIIANNWKHPTAAAIFILTISNCIILPVLFCAFGGFKCGMIFWMLAGLVFTYLVLTGYKAIIMFVIGTVADVATIMLTIKHPVLVAPIESPLTSIIDMTYSMIFIAFLICLIFKIQNYLSTKQNKKLEEAKKIAQKAADSKSDFIANTSHDIRTSINSITGFTQLAKASIDHRDKVESYLNQISASSEFLLNLVNNVLELSKIEKGITPIENTTVNIKVLVEETIQLVKIEADLKRIKLITDFSNLNDCTVRTDKVKIKQIILNLLNNSIKYTECGKNIYITINQKDAGSMDRKCGQYEIIVRDEGKGIAPEFLEKIFEPYERAKDESTKGVFGLGLGLSITKKLVTILGGTIAASSKIGEGSEFIINLSFEKVELLNEVKTQHITYNFENKRILVVDDNIINLEIATGLLEMAKIKCETALSGMQAINMLTSSTQGYYDLILMDIIMPEMDGYSATAKIRNLENPELSNIPIIAMSANAFKEDKEKATYYGLNSYITKPISYANLMETISLFL